jgi:hypothetical protein
MTATTFLTLALLVIAAGSPMANESSDSGRLLASSHWTTVLMTSDGLPVTKTLVLDPQAESSNPEKPAFLAPPDGAKAYHGHPLITESCIDGYCYGAITDFLQADTEAGCTIGNAFVQAPDGSRAGFMWEVRKERGYLTVEGPDNKRWGLYYFGIASPILTTTDMRDMFKGILPTLKKLHEQSRSK